MSYQFLYCNFRFVNVFFPAQAQAQPQPQQGPQQPPPPPNEAAGGHPPPPPPPPAGLGLAGASRVGVGYQGFPTVIDLAGARVGYQGFPQAPVLHFPTVIDLAGARVGVPHVVPLQIEAPPPLDPPVELPQLQLQIDPPPAVDNQQPPPPAVLRGDGNNPPPVDPPPAVDNQQPPPAVLRGDGNNPPPPVDPPPAVDNQQPPPAVLLGDGNNPPPPLAGADFGRWTSWAPTMVKWRFILTLMASLVLLISTVLLFLFIRFAKIEARGNSPCILTNSGVGKFCGFAVGLLIAAGLILAIGGFFFIQAVHIIRNLGCVNPGNLFASLSLFLAALILSNLPSFIYPQNGWGFWCSFSYHLYFWMIETALSVQTNTNLHSTFASINLSSSFYLILATKHFNFMVLFRPLLVLIFAAGLHTISYFVLKKFQVNNPAPNDPPTQASNPTPDPNPNPNQIFFQLFAMLRNGLSWFLRNCFWVVTISAYEIRAKMLQFCGHPIVIHQVLAPPAAVEVSCWEKLKLWGTEMVGPPQD